MAETGPDQGASGSTCHAVLSRFFPVPIDGIGTDTLTLDLYLLYGTEPTLYRKAGSPYSRDDWTKLQEQGVEFLYAPLSQHRQFRRLLADQMNAAFDDPELAPIDAARVVRTACARMIEDVMRFPELPGVAEGVGDVAQRFATWCLADEGKFSYLLDMSKHDFYTITHMVNVGVGCGLLMRCLEPADEERIAEMVQGGLLHDVGKREVPEEVLNKEGKLKPEEWKLIQAHPTAGYEILSGRQDIGAIVLEMTRDHHERLDGSGYPAGLQGSDISLPARVCAVVDVYDALTAARPYRGPIAPMQALNIMREGSGTLFDSTVFDAWCSMVEKLVTADPARAVAPSASAPGVSLAGLEASAPRSNGWDVGADRGPDSRERREYERRACDITVSAMFERRVFPPPPNLQESFEGRALDVSCGGARLVIPYPVGRGDMLRVRLSASLESRVIVRRARMTAGGEWEAGCEFVEARAASELADLDDAPEPGGAGEQAA